MDGVEFCALCALPYTTDPASPFHVSLFFSATLSSSRDTRLKDWTFFPDWAEIVRSRAEFVLEDQDGRLECEPLLERVDPVLWRACFPGDMLVRGTQVPQWQDRVWRSFSAPVVHEIARALHVTTMSTNPTEPPKPSEHMLARPLDELMVEAGHFMGTFDGPHYFSEERLTRALDDVIERRGSLRETEQLVARQSGLSRILLELHRARRYYERPEAQREYRARPEPGSEPPDPPVPEPEFHQACVFAGDHPVLMRHLGLVVDLKVHDLERLRTASSLSADVLIDGRSGLARQTRVACSLSGSDLVATPRTADWTDGALRLGDEERFKVLSLDTDGSALKTERFIWTLPRLELAERNGDPVNAATPAMRSPGFTVAAIGNGIATQDQLQQQTRIQQLLASSDIPELHLEDVARGYRAEVWDETTQAWSSLHCRIADIEVEGYDAGLKGLDDEGFVQGSAANETPDVDNSPIHVHDALFGWDGWSLSVPRPGKRAAREKGVEKLLSPEEDGPGPAIYRFRVRHKLKHGTLPRLRYGRQYAFRAWAVDLAGNTRPTRSVPDVAFPIIPWLIQPDISRNPASELRGELRAAARAVLANRTRPAEPPPASPQQLWAALGSTASAAPILDHLRSRRVRVAASPASRGISRPGIVSSVFAQALEDERRDFIRDTADRSPERLANVVGAQVASSGLWDGREETLGAAVRAAQQTTTALQPFLRWEPVSSPVLVPRRKYSDGESLRVLVIRSGVVQDTGTLAITVADPEAYSASPAIAAAGYWPQCERHLAPPKISQLQAEMHGLFDSAIGSDSAAERRRMLGWILRENGTFQCETRADIDNPGDTIPQPGMSIVHVGTPTTNLKTLPLDPGEPLAPGQTVIHDVDELALPYLPDPLARGLSLVFPEAGKDRPNIPFFFGTEGFTVDYRGSWPEIEPIRFVLNGGDVLDSRVDGKVLTITLPPGDIQKFRLSSCIARDKLDLLGPWRSLPDAVTTNAEVREAATDGWLWALSPSEDIVLIHAVSRPLEIPRAMHLTPLRAPGSTQCRLIGAVDVHGPSTDSLSLTAHWCERFDDLTLPIYEVRKSSADVYRTQVQPNEDFALLTLFDADTDVPVPGIGTVRAHRSVHEFGDTRHRLVKYRFRAATRFREYFRPDLIAPALNDPLDDGMSVVGPEVTLSIPSSARPAAPIVHSVIPLFRWSDEEEPEQPMARRRRRSAGLRIYLERPWYSSGDGELLAILLAPGANDTIPRSSDPSGFPFVSKWGSDPFWTGADVGNRAMDMNLFDDPFRVNGIDDRPRPARPVAYQASLPLTAIEGSPNVAVLGYEPKYNEERQLWYVDVAIDQGDHFWPFVRLSVARYQPDSVAGCHLSAPIRCDFAQLTPDRTLSVSRTDSQHVRVVLTGAAGRHEPARETDEPITPLERLSRTIANNRAIVASLQRRDDDIPGDLGWKTVKTTRMTLRGSDADGPDVAWMCELDAGEEIDLIRPGHDGPRPWRVRVEEWEMLEGDAQPDSILATFARVWREPRLIYADEIEL